MTVRSAAYDLQVAIFDRLQAALPDVRISEKTKKNTPPPYIELYDITIMQTVEIKGGNDLQRLRLTLRLFDETENSDWIKDTTDDILAALTQTKLVLGNGFTLYNTIHERTSPSELLNDRKTWRGITQFQFSVIQNS